MVIADTTTYSDTTMFKVKAALEKVVDESPYVQVLGGEITRDQFVFDAIVEMQNAGIFFRENLP